MYLFCTLYRFICSIGCTLISCFQNIWKYWRGFNLSTLSWGMLNSSSRKEHFDWLSFLLPSWYIILSFFCVFLPFIFITDFITIVIIYLPILITFLFLLFVLYYSLFITLFIWLFSNTWWNIGYSCILVITIA